MSFEPSAFLLPGETAPGLRPLTWHGLCAQITALQDLRRSMAHISGASDTIPGGSFDGATARLIATGFSGNPAQIMIRKQGVNPTSSANGKPLLGTPDDTKPSVWTGHAEARD
ncbi:MULTISPECIES: hypothetical protein [unclassified Novosphingobium]|uniref:hypothetical protein n=1 Tax=unclassified Novosphingobium TaxID=2644732 RepID=UPI002600FEE8|nr:MULTISPECIES: hypothetical protein [unclassified Novosphingobium]HQS69940.1 hypothetical protein [Novosphingobium sp.]